MFQMSKASISLLRLALLLWAVIQIGGCGSPEERAQNHYERGMQLLAKNDYPKAAIEFKNALQTKKEHVGAWRGLSKVEEHNGEWTSVAQILRKVVEIDPKDLDSRLRLARVYVLFNELDEALKQVDAAEKLNAHDASVLALRAAVQLKLNDPEGAVRAAKSSLEAKPGNTEALIVLAAERMSQNDFQGALKILDGTAENEADQLGVQLFKMKLYEQMGQQEKVEALLRKLVGMYPKEVAFRRQLVKYYVAQKRLDDAEKEVRAIAKEDPANIEAGLDVVRFLNTLRSPAAAQEELTARIGAGGDVFQYRMTLADLLLAQGKADEGTKLLDELVHAADTDARVLAVQTRLAEAQLSNGKLEETQALVAQILGKDARNSAALRLRASLHMERGEYDAATSDLRQALADQPKSTQLMQLQAVVYERKGEIELADRQYTDAMRVSDFEPAVGLNYVAFLRRRGNAARAEDVLTELLSHAPTNVAILSTLAEVRLARQDWSGAQEIADTLRKSGSDQGAADQILAAALNGQQKYDESVGLLQNAYAAVPGSPRPMYALVSTLIRAGKTDRALAFLQAVLEKNPDNADAMVLTASIQLANNEPDKAVATLQAAIKQKPDSIVSYRALANVYLQKGETDEALKVVQAGLKAQPNNGSLRLVLASALERKGDFEAAISEYEGLLKQQSGSMIITNNLASLLSDHRSDKESLEKAHALAVSLRKSDVPQFKDTLGWVYYRRGEYKDAAPLLEEAVKELPDVAMVRYHLGMTYVAMGEPAKASEQLGKGLELASNDADVKEKIQTALQQLGKS
jgi:tetratricopeptide (TPR) repeat protein